MEPLVVRDAGLQQQLVGEQIEGRPEMARDLACDDAGTRRDVVSDVTTKVRTAGSSSGRSSTVWAGS
jgi:hypothetical protein